MSALSPQQSSSRSASTSADSSNFFTERTYVSEVKHGVLRRYLGAWLAILSQNQWRTGGRWFSNSNPQYSRIAYVDGFAGPGIYDNGDEGSPAVVYKLALTHKSLRKNGPVICLIFAEKNQSQCNKLFENLNSIRVGNAGAVNEDIVSFMVINDEFLNAMEWILSATFTFPSAPYEQVFRVPAHGSQPLSPVPFIGQDTPLMVFADPFGFNGENMPMTLMRRIMNASSKSEILVNLMTGHIRRFWGLDNRARAINLLVGNDANDSHWKGSVLEAEDGKEKLKIFLQYYIDSLEEGGHSFYTCLFEMRSELNRLKYNLFYASPHNKGFQRMKDAMGKESIDKNLFRFSVFDVKHEEFEVKEVSIEDLANKIVGEFRGKGNVSGEDITGYIERDPHLTQRYRVQLRKALADYRVSQPEVKKFDEMVFNFPLPDEQFHID